MIADGPNLFTTPRPAPAAEPELGLPATPRECERLQGFPDDYTLIPYKGKPADKCPDGPRYKSLGNSMARNAMRWLGLRIHAVEQGVLV